MIVVKIMHCIPVATVFVVRSILFCNNGSCIPGLGERDLILESKMSGGGYWKPRRSLSWFFPKTED